VERPPWKGFAFRSPARQTRAVPDTEGQPMTDKKAILVIGAGGAIARRYALEGYIA
jgi:hypothetical protein